jgi:hypothetical protein
MNERIKQLAEQAGFKVNWQHADVQAIKMARFEKFAELIVLECSSICYKGLENGDEAASLLMNTFGVEE